MPTATAVLKHYVNKLHTDYSLNSNHFYFHVYSGDTYSIVYFLLLIHFIFVLYLILQALFQFDAFLSFELELLGACKWPIFCPANFVYEL